MRTAVISDIHGNIEAFRAVLDDIDHQGGDRIISLGDNIGYGADSEAVVQLMMDRTIDSVLGNHELACINKKVYNWYIGDVKTSLDYTLSQLTESSIRHLETMALNLIWETAFFVHGFWPESVRHYLHQIPDEEILKAFEQMAESICFLGHTHRIKLLFEDNGSVQTAQFGSEPIRLDENRKYMVNVGSVGQPRDGGPSAKYLIWDRLDNTLTVRYVDYDYKAAARKVIDRGLPFKYARAIDPGIQDGG